MTCGKVWGVRYTPLHLATPRYTSLQLGYGMGLRGLENATGRYTPLQVNTGLGEKTLSFSGFIPTLTLP